MPVRLAGLDKQVLHPGVQDKFHITSLMERLACGATKFHPFHVSGDVQGSRKVEYCKALQAGNSRSHHSPR